MDPVNVPAKFEVCSFTRFWDNSECSPWIRCSRSSKVVDFGTNQKRVYDFLLVRNSNLGPILHRYGDIAGFFALPSDPTPIPPQFWGCSRCTRSPMLRSALTQAVSYSAVKLFSKNCNLCDHGTSSRTDRQIDRQYTIAIPRFALQCIAR